MTHFELLVNTKTVNHPLALVDTELSDDVHGRISVKSRNVRRVPGMTTADILISVAVGIGAGIPASVAANWIYTKLGIGTDTKLHDEVGKVLVTVEALERAIVQLSEREGGSRPVDSEGHVGDSRKNLDGSI